MRFAEEGAARLPYGEGTYRRRVLLVAEEGRVVGDLEDDFHRYRVVLDHDGERVRGVRGDAARYPWTQCPGAFAPLQALRDLPLATSPAAAARHANARANCTHLFDLATLALAHAASGRARRRYDAAVPDRVDDFTRPALECDGAPVLAWEVRGGAVEGPPPYGGRDLRGTGFLRWAEEALDPDAAEAAFVLRRAVFISAGRWLDLDGARDASSLFPWAESTCHSFTPGVAERALRLRGSGRDFSHEPERLLADVLRRQRS